MFRGNHPAKIDEKGRLKLPSAFKQLADSAGVKEFYVTSIEGKSAEIWPLPEWQKREDQLAASSEFDDAARKYLARTSYWGQQVEMDAQSRIVLPQLLRKSAGLDDVEVTVIGMRDHLEVHNRQKFEAELMASEFTASDRQAMAELLRRKD
jgi:MraZ protein